MPAEIPVTLPEILPIVAMEVLLLVQMPPGVAFVKIAEDPTHTDDGPVMAEGTAFADIIRVATHPEPVV